MKSVRERTKILLGAILLIVSCLPGFAQTDTSVLNRLNKSLWHYTITNPTEKVYLQFDKPYYNIGDTIWFKAYNLLNGSLPAQSGILYVELINNRDSVLNRLNVRLNPCIGWGDIPIPADYPPGQYRIRAYTRWIAEGGTGFFDKIIYVGVTPEPAANLPVANALFYPEGGTLVGGLRTKIAIKFTDSNGTGKAASGQIIDNDGNIAAAFTTLNNGIGLFALTPVLGKTYKAVIDGSDDQKLNFNLPGPQASGFSLLVNNRQGDSAYVKIAANEEMLKTTANGRFYIIAQSGGHICYTAGGVVDGAPFSSRIAKKGLPGGIVQFVLFNGDGKPLARRLIYNQLADTLTIGLLQKRQHFELAIKNSQNKPDSGSIAVSVIKENENLANSGEENLRSYMALSSEITDVVNQPAYYFTSNAATDLDGLLLTEDYKGFENWDKILAKNTNKLIYQPEQDLTIEGFIKTPDGKPLPGTKVSLLCLSQGLSADTLADANGYFKFNRLDITGNAKVIIKATNPKVKQLNIFVREPDYPVVQAPPSVVLPSNAAVTSNMPASDNNPQLQLWKKTGLLKQVEIKEVKAERPDKANGYGAADVFTIHGSDLKDYILLTDALIEKLPGAFYRDGKFTDFRGGRTAVFHVVLNNHEIPVTDININVGTDEIEDVKLLKGRINLITYGVTTSTQYGNIDAIILITTKKFAGTEKPPIVSIKNVMLALPNAGGQLKPQPFITSTQPSGYINYDFTGYATQDDFKPITNKIISGTLSKFSTVYWNPNIAIDVDGKAAIDLEGPGTYRIVIEGIDGEGHLGRAVYMFKVE